MSGIIQDINQKDNLTELADELPELENDPASTPTEDDESLQDPAENQVIGTDGELIDLGEDEKSVRSK
ncbi:MAG TPA: hypothetical protein VLE44_00755 [Candidatus Saccharimonadales bacterium]|nr:hypothetical protein [Candidatus Saccharimonadales bacterium]